MIAVTFQVIAVGLYRIFIRPETCQESTLMSALDISNFHDLKITLIQVAMVILIILFLEQAVEVGAALETLYFGRAIGVIIVAGVFAFKNMEQHRER